MEMIKHGEQDFIQEKSLKFKCLTIPLLLFPKANKKCFIGAAFKLNIILFVFVVASFS